MVEVKFFLTIIDSFCLISSFFGQILSTFVWSRSRCAQIKAAEALLGFEVVDSEGNTVAYNLA
jgi:hypothetical protein